MKITCDGCRLPIQRNDGVAPLKGAFKNKEMVIGCSTKQMKHFWKECRFDATYWCLSCWKRDREFKAKRDCCQLPYKSDFTLMVEWGMISREKLARMEKYNR